MTTNREWLESLTDKQLAAFLTGGLLVKYNNCDDIEPFVFNIRQLIGSYMQSTLGVEKWLSEPLLFKIID